MGFNVFLVFTGGVAGSAVRLGLSALMNVAAPKKRDFPVAMLAINLILSFLAGFFWIFITRSCVKHDLRLLLVLGFLGGFTAFSAFAHDAVLLWHEDRRKQVIFNLLLNNIGAIVFLLAGMLLSGFVSSAIK